MSGNLIQTEFEVAFRKQVDKVCTEMRTQAGDVALQAILAEAPQTRIECERQAQMLLGRIEGLRDSVKMFASIRYMEKKK